MKMIFKYLARSPVFKEPLIKSWMNSLSPARITNRWPIAALVSTCNRITHALIPTLGHLALENTESQSVSSRLNQRFLRHHGVTFIVLSWFTSPIYADVTVNNLEKNDKIVGHSLSVQNETNEQATSGRAMDEQSGGSLSANKTSKAWVLHAEQWELARSGESILSLPVLNQLINTWLLEKSRKIEVQYPGGEEGEFWVQELTDWLVSLGIPSNHMVIVPASGADDMIKFGLIK